MASMSVGFLAPLTLGTVWDRLVEKASRRGVHLSRHLPENTLPAGPDTRRRIYVVADVGDDTVPLSQAQSLATLLQGHAEKYDATVWTTSASCHGSSHCMQLLDEYEDYETRRPEACAKLTSVGNTSASRLAWVHARAPRSKDLAGNADVDQLSVVYACECCWESQPRLSHDLQRSQDEGRPRGTATSGAKMFSG